MALPTVESGHLGPPNRLGCQSQPFYYRFPLGDSLLASASRDQFLASWNAVGQKNQIVEQLERLGILREAPPLNDIGTPIEIVRLFGGGQIPWARCTHEF